MRFSARNDGILSLVFYKRHPRISVTIDILAQAEPEAALVEDRIDVG